jgi:uncharacterized protein (DUF1330 family)
MANGYAVILLDVHDTDLYIEYAKKATSIEARYGGRPIVVGDAKEVVDGIWPTQRIDILEFPSLEQARGWYRDPEYEALIPSAITPLDPRSSSLKDSNATRLDGATRDSFFYRSLHGSDIRNHARRRS